MKKFLIFIVLILNLSIVSAGMGKTIFIDFSLRDDYIVPMQLNDRVAFSLKNGNHTIILDKIDKKAVELDIFLFLKRKHNPYYTFIDKEHSNKIDFERDGEKDLLIKLISFDDKKAVIQFKNLNVNEEKVEKSISSFIYSFIYYIITIIIILIIGLIYFNARKTRIDKENAGAGI